MCGIAGALGRVDDLTLGAVHAADDAQIHRGPDGNGFWADPGAGVALAHRRLAIIDLSLAAAQPMTDPARGTALVFNGEVYNFRELRQELEADGFTFRSKSDTEVILYAYAKWGADCVHRLRGMFALAIWDGCNRSLLLARDQLGQKPLYYTFVPHPAGGNVLLFSSELRSLLATGLVERRIDPQGLAGYIWNGFVPGPGTLIRNVRQLPPGSMLTLRPGESPGEPETYWVPPPATPGTTTPEMVCDQMAACVAGHMVSDVPVGVFLSGGLDSASVARLATAAVPGRVRTFTVGFDDPALDESIPAALIAAAIGTEHSTVWVTGNEFLTALPAALASLDQPTFDGLNSFVVSRAVRDAGITVALAGTGGDELFGGYKSFSEVPAGMRWARRLGWAPAKRALLSAICRLYYRGGVPPQTRWGKIADVLEASDILPMYQVRAGLFTRKFASRLLGGGPHEKSIYGLPAERFDLLSRQIANQPDLHAISHLELSLYLGDRLLRDTDATGMAASLEVRLPLIDHQLVAGVAGLSEADRFGPLGQKQFLRQHVLKGLDPALFDRPKQGFEMPFGRWLRGPLRAVIDPVMRDMQLAAAIGLDPTTVVDLWDAFLAGGRGLYWSRVWGLFALLDWCRRYRVVI